LTFVAAIAVLSALVRFGVALCVHTPIFYPDEYLYTALSRAIADGRFAEIRGGHIPLRATTAYLGPVLWAPMWLLAGVGVAYRLCQALGSVAFATAAFPAYALARRIGITGRGAASAALLTVAVPSGIFTSMLLSEPYAYPLFLLAVLAWVEAISAPTVARQIGAVLLGLGLSAAGGLQFLYFVPACLAAYLFLGASSARSYLVRAAIVLACAAYLVHAVEARFVRVSYPLETLGSWFLVNLFVFAIGAGWVVVPGGFVGLARLMKAGDRRSRAFALLTMFLLGAMLLEATVWSASGQGVYERFAFYGAPLVVVAFVWAVESGSLVKRDVAVVAYLGAAGAALLPALQPLHDAGKDHAPTLQALSRFAYGGGTGAVVWAPILAGLALFAAWQSARSGWSLVVLAATICIAISAGSSLAYVQLKPTSITPHVHAPSGSALVVWSGANRFFLMKTLFWNPRITRVLVLGPGGAPDDFPFTQAALSLNRGLETPSGTALPGPYVFTSDTTVLGGAASQASSGFTVERSMPAGVAFGWFGKLGYFGTVVQVFMTAPDRRTLLLARFKSPSRESETISIRCSGGVHKEIDVGAAVVTEAVQVPRRSRRSCSLRMTRGTPKSMGQYTLSVKGSLALRGSRAAASLRRS
jgi:hypothetical protein